MFQVAFIKIGIIMLQIKKISIVFILIATAITSNLVYARVDVSHIILVQNSGWMLPFYEDPNSKIKDLVVELSNRVSPYGRSELVIASFNQSVGENKSPMLVYSGSDKALLKSSVNGIQLARKPGKQSYADTDFKEAIVGAITEFSPGKPCLLWIVTNNKNSPDNSAETIEKNRDFYNFLQITSEIKRIVTFPHPMKVQSRTKSDYKANGLMIYALAYGEAADQVLRQMLEANMPFGKRAARLKPLNAEALTFVPKGVKNNNVDVSLAADRKTLVLKFSADTKPEIAELIGQFRNDFFPYDIKSADVEIYTDGFKAVGGEKITAELSTKAISNIPAGGLSPDINVKIKVPAIPSPWDPKVILDSGYTSRGLIRFELENQKLEISKDFTQSMSQLFPRDPLPDLFMPGEAAKKSVTFQAFIIQVQYPTLPLLIVATLGLLMLGGIVGGAIIMRREKIYRVSIDDNQKSYGLKPFAEVIIKDQYGARVGVLRRGINQAKLVLDKGKTNSVRVI
jgi:hypothetical protein